MAPKRNCQRARAPIGKYVSFVGYEVAKECVEDINFLTIKGLMGKREKKDANGHR